MPAAGAAPYARLYRDVIYRLTHVAHWTPARQKQHRRSYQQKLKQHTSFLSYEMPSGRCRRLKRMRQSLQYLPLATVFEERAAIDGAEMHVMRVPLARIGRARFESSLAAAPIGMMASRLSSPRRFTYAHSRELARLLIYVRINTRARGSLLSAPLNAHESQRLSRLYHHEGQLALSSSCSLLAARQAAFAIDARDSPIIATGRYSRSHRALFDASCAERVIVGSFSLSCRSLRTAGTRRQYFARDRLHAT